MSSSIDATPDAGKLPLALDRDLFLRRLLRDLSGVLEEVVGLREAEGFIAVVGQRMADWMNDEYRHAFGVKTLDPDQLAATLVDLKRRIQGGFRIESIDAAGMVLVNDRCPFGEFVRGRESLCQMTTSVFGTLAAENLGHAFVHIDEALARGDARCRVRVRFGLAGASEGGVEFLRGVRA
ncbi:MAG: methanogen output domain 1-containing protein [Aquimonas sp.]|nr:methanogen output domain 1-containing protein [Aquimonas sp.]